MNVPLSVALPVLALTALAAVVDVRTRRIPNLLTGPAMLLGPIVLLATQGPLGLKQSLLGLVVAGGILLPGWMMGWMGAGDVKLMAAVGAWLGFPLSVFATLATLMAGGVLALVIAARHGVLKRSLWGAAVLGTWAATQSVRSAPPPVTTGVRFPFAFAVFAGTMTSLWVQL